MSLLNLFYSGKKIRELILFFQVVLLIMVTCLATVPFENILNEYKVIENSMDNNLKNRLLTFMPGLALMESFYTPEIEINSNGTVETSTENYTGKELLKSITKMISEEECIDTIYQSYTGNAVFSDGVDDKSAFNATVIVLPDNVLNDFSYNLPSDNPSGIYISSNLGSTYQPGYTLSLNWIDGNKCDVEYKITAVLPEDFSFLNIGGSNNPYYQIADDENLIIIVSLDEISDLLYFEPFFLVSVMEGTTKEEIEQLNETYSQYGTFVYTNDYLSERLNDTLRQDKWNMLIMLLTFIVTIVGFFGYSIFRLINKNKVFKVLYICGFSKLQILSVNAFSVLIIILPAFIVSVLSSPAVINYLGFYDFSGFSGNFLVFLCIIVLLTGCICLLISAKLLSKDLATIQSCKQ